MVILFLFNVFSQLRIRNFSGNFENEIEDRYLGRVLEPVEEHFGPGTIYTSATVAPKDMRF